MHWNNNIHSILGPGQKQVHCEILFINSPVFRDSHQENGEDNLPPLGLGYIATHLQTKGHKVELIDAVFNNISIKKLTDIIESTKPKFVAINIFSTNYELVKEIVESVRIRVDFIIGGIVVKSIYKQIHNWNSNNHIDIVFGDGELITEDIVNNSLCQKPIAISDNRRFFTVDKNSPYFIDDISNLPLNRSFFEHEPILNHHGNFEISIITSRGCIHDCAFCSAAISMNRDIKVREKKKESIKNELHQISKLYPNVTAIRILDDLFLKNRQSIIDAIEIFSETKYKWRSMAHVKTFKEIDHSLLAMLRKSGCIELFIGIESGSKRILKIINKERNSVDTQAILRKILMSNIGVKGYFVLGFPSETEEDFIKTYELAKKIKNISLAYDSCFRVSVFQFRPYHGTKIYNDLFIGNTEEKPEIVENTRLTKLIGGRSSFNFTSGVYSESSEALLYKFIKDISNLNKL